MRNRTLHTSINLLVEVGLYQRLRMASKLKKTSMSKLVRDGIKLKLAQIDKENNAVMGGKNDERPGYKQGSRKKQSQDEHGQARSRSGKGH